MLPGWKKTELDGWRESTMQWQRKDRIRTKKNGDWYSEGVGDVNKPIHQQAYNRFTNICIKHSVALLYDAVVFTAKVKFLNSPHRLLVILIIIWKIMIKLLSGGRSQSLFCSIHSQFPTGSTGTRNSELLDRMSLRNSTALFDTGNWIFRQWFHFPFKHCKVVIYWK